MSEHKSFFKKTACTIEFKCRPNAINCEYQEDSDSKACSYFLNGNCGNPLAKESALQKLVWMYDSIQKIRL